MYSEIFSETGQTWLLNEACAYLYSDRKSGYVIVDEERVKRCGLGMPL
jgi:hypothetical protein